VVSTGFQDEQRLAFGRVAELYDRARPSYPAGAIDDVLEHGGLGVGARVLEVGAGTGKLTVLLAARGLRVLALEPSGAMAAVARANCTDLGGVRIVEAEFEGWQPSECFPALVCAAAWHWIDPGQRCRLAYQALAPGATLAALWTFPDWSRCALRDALSDAYRAGAPPLAPDFPMHPDSEPERLVGARPGRVRDGGQWAAEIAGSAGAFVAPETRLHPCSATYTADQYIDLLQTHQDHILLGPEQRRRLLDAVAEAITSRGDSIELPLVTHVCLARRAANPLETSPAPGELSATLRFWPESRKGS